MQSTFIKFMMRFQSAFLLAIGIWLIGGVLGALFQFDTFEPHRADETQHSNPLLVLCQSLLEGYNFLSLMRASWVVNRQWTVEHC